MPRKSKWEIEALAAQENLKQAKLMLTRTTLFDAANAVEVAYNMARLEIRQIIRTAEIYKPKRKKK